MDPSSKPKRPPIPVITGFILGIYLFWKFISSFNLFLLRPLESPLMEMIKVPLFAMTSLAIVIGLIGYIRMKKWGVILITVSSTIYFFYAAKQLWMSSNIMDYVLFVFVIGTGMVYYRNMMDIKNLKLPPALVALTAFFAIYLYGKLLLFSIASFAFSHADTFSIARVTIISLFVASIAGQCGSIGYLMMKRWGLWSFCFSNFLFIIFLTQGQGLFSWNAAKALIPYLLISCVGIIYYRKMS